MLFVTERFFAFAVAIIPVRKWTREIPRPPSGATIDHDLDTLSDLYTRFMIRLSSSIEKQCLLSYKVGALNT